jgi:hypothetical protein
VYVCVRVCVCVCVCVFSISPCTYTLSTQILTDCEVYGESVPVHGERPHVEVVHVDHRVQ